jgi:hypothetical protein
MPQFLSSVPLLPSSYSGGLASRNSTDVNVFLRPFYNPSKSLHSSDSNWTHCLSQSHSYFTTDGLPPISSSWRQAPWDSRPAFFCQLNIWGISPYVTSSLTWRWVCCLQLLLVIASAVIPRSDSRGTHYRILLRFRTPQTLKARSSYLYLPGTGWTSYTPRHWVLLSPPPTTRRATVPLHELSNQPLVYNHFALTK